MFVDRFNELLELFNEVPEKEQEDILETHRISIAALG